MKKILFYLFVLIMILLVIGFAILGARNTTEVTLDLMIFTVQARLSTIMGGLLFTGFISGMFSLLVMQGRIKLKRSLAARKTRKQTATKVTTTEATDA